MKKAIRAQDQCYTGPVSNLTLTIDVDVLRRARIRALEQGTSVNAVVREYLAGYAGAHDQESAARQRLLDLSKRTDAGSGRRGRSWTREDVYRERGASTRDSR